MTKFYDWEDRLDIGVDQMNHEHQILIDHMNKVYEAQELKLSKDEKLERLEKLAGYVVEHFEHEEAYMESINYGEIGVHKRIHKNLLERFAEHMDDFKAGDGNFHPEFFDFLKVWLSAHICGIDMKYGDFVKGKVA